MAKVDLKYVQAFRDRHGRKRHYFRRKGCKRIPLPGNPGSPEFMDAYKTCVAAVAAPADAAKGRPQPRSLNALIMEYYRSAEWKALKPSTQKGYRISLEAFREKHSAKGVAGIETHHLEAIFHHMADTPAAALNLRKRLRRVFKLAVKLGWRTTNPVTETEAPRIKSAGFTPWSEDDIAAFEARWPSGTKERLALALLLYTGQRCSDVVTMGRQHVEGDSIRVRQLKTDARLKIKMAAPLRREIEAAPAGLTFMTSQYGAPYAAASFSIWFIDRARKAGLSGRTPHGLRKAAGRRLAEAGCTAKQIAAVLGHATLSEVERYTRDADQAALAAQAVGKLEKNSGRTRSVKPV